MEDYELSEYHPWLLDKPGARCVEVHGEEATQFAERPDRIHSASWRWSMKGEGKETHGESKGYLLGEVEQEQKKHERDIRSGSRVKNWNDRITVKANNESEKRIQWLTRPGEITTKGKRWCWWRQGQKSNEWSGWQRRRERWKLKQGVWNMKESNEESIWNEENDCTDKHESDESERRLKSLRKKSNQTEQRRKRRNYQFRRGGWRPREETTEVRWFKTFENCGEGIRVNVVGYGQLSKKQEGSIREHMAKEGSRRNQKSKTNQVKGYSDRVKMARQRSEITEMLLQSKAQSGEDVTCRCPERMCGKLDDRLREKEKVRKHPQVSERWKHILGLLARRRQSGPGGRSHEKHLAKLRGTALFRVRIEWIQLVLGSHSLTERTNWMWTDSNPVIDSWLFTRVKRYGLLSRRDDSRRAFEKGRRNKHCDGALCPANLNGEPKTQETKDCAENSEFVVVE